MRRFARARLISLVYGVVATKQQSSEWATEQQECATVRMERRLRFNGCGLLAPT